ncbi:MAG: hypothetical protein HY314_01830 [Acidobacteria bacterium]|nr:hypothetical protein [Acidobacteriota bacterium]
MPRVKQLVVTLENKPGALAQIASTLREAKVNISAVLAPDISGKGKVRLVVDNPDKAKEALKAAKIRASEEEAVAVNLANKPGALAEAAQKLAQSRVNIKYAYATVPEGSRKATTILGVSNVAKALSALGEAETPAASPQPELPSA